MMNSADILWGLLIVSTYLAFQLLILSLLAFGRTTGDLDRQTARGVTGGPRLQVYMNLLLYANLMGIGAVFGTINLLLLNGTAEIVRMWLNRGLWTFLLLSCNVLVILLWLVERAQITLSIRKIKADRKALAQALEAVDVVHIQPTAVEQIAERLER